MSAKCSLDICAANLNKSQFTNFLFIYYKYYSI